MLVICAITADQHRLAATIILLSNFILAAYLKLTTITFNALSACSAAAHLSCFITSDLATAALTFTEGAADACLRRCCAPFDNSGAEADAAVAAASTRKLSAADITDGGCNCCTAAGSPFPALRSLTVWPANSSQGASLGLHSNLEPEHF